MPRNDATIANLEGAAREVDALLDGDAGEWTLDGEPVTDAAGAALLSLHDYLTDLDA